MNPFREREERGQNTNLDWEPDFITSVAGTTFKDDLGIPRSTHIAKALKLLDRYKKLSVLLVRDRDNKYDPTAIKIMLPTKDTPAGEQTGYEHVGFVPTRVCWECGANWSDSKGLDRCPACNKPAEARKNFLSKYMSEKMDSNYIDELSSEIENKQFKVGVAWISRNESLNRGVKLGYKDYDEDI